MIDEDDSEKTLVLDLWYVHVAAIKRWYFGWPSAQEAIERLEQLISAGVTFTIAAYVFKDYRREAVRKWLEYYASLSEHLNKAAPEPNPLAVDTLDKIAYMLDKPVPNSIQVLAKRHLKQEALEARRRRSKGQSFGSVVEEAQIAAKAVLAQPDINDNVPIRGRVPRADGDSSAAVDFAHQGKGAFEL